MISSDALLLIGNVNAALCTVIGISLNVLLIWAAVKKTPKALQPNLAIVLHSCTLNTVLLVLTFHLRPSVQQSVDGFPVLTISKNLLVPFPPWLNTMIAKFWLFLVLFVATSSTSVQFGYRYLFLKRKMAHFTTSCIYFGLLLFVAILQTIFTGFFVFNAREQQLLGVDNSSQNAKNIMPTHSESAPINNGIWILLGVIYNIFNYLFIIFCAIKIEKLMRRDCTTNAKQIERKFNRQFNFSMFIQASLTTFVYALIVLLSACAASLRRPFLSASSSLLCPALISWLHALLPLITLCSIVSFRLALPRLPIQLVNHPTASPIGSALATQHKMRRCSVQFVPIFTVDCKLDNGTIRSRSTADDRQRIDQLSKMNHHRVFSKNIRISPVSHQQLTSPPTLLWSNRRNSSS